MQPTEKPSADRVTDESPHGPDPRVGARIARSRREAELTQRALADRIGVRLWMVDQWEIGARAVPQERLVRVAEVTGRSAQWLLTGVDERVTEQTAERPVIGPADAALEAAELERLARVVAERERALAEREAELEALARRIDDTHVRADERLAEVESQARELGEHRRELEERERLLEKAEQERSQVDEAIVGKALISAQRVADLLQAEAAQEAGTTVAAARIEAEAMVARAQHTRELADRDRAQVNELLTQLRAAVEEAVAKLNSLAPDVLDDNRQEGGQDRGGVSPTARADGLVKGVELDLDGDLHVRAGGAQSDAEDVGASDT